MRISPSRLALSLLASALLPVRAVDAAPAGNPDARAAATERAMTDAERTVLTYGIMPLQGFAVEVPADAIPGAGYVAGIPRLAMPALKETDASLGVASVGGLRKDGSTALPSAMAMASSWNPGLVRRAGAMIGGEAHSKGFNVMLAGGVNLMRDPRNGRTFEYFGEDPLLSGVMAGGAVAGIQSMNVIATVKHFALNGQETGRHFVDSRISDAAARESDLLAFQIAIERGQPGSVMCAYNKVNGQPACASDYLLNKVLKHDWRYRGWVMSDWGAVPGMEAALAGLDQQSGAQIDASIFFGKALREKAASDPRYADRLGDMNRRILRSIYAVGVDRHPPGIKPIDFKANAQVAQDVADEGIVLLRNRAGALPLAASAKRIAIIGGYADTGVLSGGGSSQVQGEGGPAAAVPLGGDGSFALAFAQAYHRSSPLKAIKALAPDADITYRNGDYITDAVAAARKADVAIVFATQWQTEGLDVPDLSLPHGQDDLIAAVAAANPDTIVVLETGGPVLMPWLDRTAAVLAVWFPGARGGEAIASILFGRTNPSGHLPVTFPASLDQLPRPKLDGADSVEPNISGQGKPGQTLAVDYDIEGSDVGYRWFARTGARPLFPFGYGLSYTTFDYTGLSLKTGSTLTASFSVRNTGQRGGSAVPQLYLVSVAGQPVKRLAGFSKLTLAPGEVKRVEVTIDPRLLARWQDGWTMAPGAYGFALGDSAASLGAVQTIRLGGRHWAD
jgi:beta-glucosidase